MDNIGAAYNGSTLHQPSSASTVMAVFYDPNGGFVTGGGYINHTATGMIPGPTVGSKANYGFVAKYKKGATTPDGETEFQLKPNINFHTSSLDWLVINTTATRAQYQGTGTGTVNGTGSYGFIVTVIDYGSTDYFRIRIWQKSNPANIIYDNEPGRPDSTDPITLAAGGNIVIHK